MLRDSKGGRARPACQQPVGQTSAHQQRGEHSLSTRGSMPVCGTRAVLEPCTRPFSAFICPVCFQGSQSVHLETYAPFAFIGVRVVISGRLHRGVSWLNVLLGGMICSFSAYPTVVHPCPESLNRFFHQPHNPSGRADPRWRFMAGRGAAKHANQAQGFPA